MTEEKYYKMVDNQRMEMTKEEVENLLADRAEINASQWSRNRQLEYGTFADQLNQIWDDIDAGLFGSNAKNSTWYLKIRSVKQAIPKPSGSITGSPENPQSRGIK